MITVYSVLDDNDYRRLETLSQTEAEQYAYMLGKSKEKTNARVVASQREPIDHRKKP